MKEENGAGRSKSGRQGVAQAKLVERGLETHPAHTDRFFSTLTGLRP